MLFIHIHSALNRNLAQDESGFPKFEDTRKVKIGLVIGGSKMFKQFFQTLYEYAEKEKGKILWTRNDTADPHSVDTDLDDDPYANNDVVEEDSEAEAASNHDPASDDETGGGHESTVAPADTTPTGPESKVDFDDTGLEQHGRHWLLPDVQEVSCVQRDFHGLLDQPRVQHGDIALALGEKDAECFASRPLWSFGLSDFVRRQPVDKLPTPGWSPDQALPFDLAAHPLLQFPLAQHTVKRFEHDVQSFREQQESKTQHCLIAWPSDLSTFAGAAREEPVDRTVLGSTATMAATCVQSLLKSLRQYVEADATLVDAALHAAINLANSNAVAANPEKNTFSARMRGVVFDLARQSGNEVSVGPELLIQLLLHTNGREILQAWNPLLTDDAVDATLSLTTLFMLFASRKDLALRCADSAHTLLLDLDALRDMCSTGDSKVGATTSTNAEIERLLLKIELKAAALSKAVASARHYFKDPNTVDTEGTKSAAFEAVPKPAEVPKPLLMSADDTVPDAAEEKVETKTEPAVVPENTNERESSEQFNTFHFDPRFLFFEFTHGIMLRQAQVLMVRQFIQALHKPGGSRVEQLIMGAGKTTVVSPLVALLAADGQSLVVQVVPKPLLSFSQSVLFERLNSFGILHRHVFVFSFDRNYDVPEQLVEKLERAKTHKGVVCSTPIAIKSFALKFIELVHDYEIQAPEDTPTDKQSGKFIHIWGYIATLVIFLAFRCGSVSI